MIKAKAALFVSLVFFLAQVAKGQRYFDEPNDTVQLAPYMAIKLPINVFMYERFTVGVEVEKSITKRISFNLRGDYTTSKIQLFDFQETPNHHFSRGLTIIPAFRLYFDHPGLELMEGNLFYLSLGLPLRYILTDEEKTFGINCIDRGFGFGGCDYWQRADVQYASYHFGLMVNAGIMRKMGNWFIDANAGFGIRTNSINYRKSTIDLSLVRERDISPPWPYSLFGNMFVGIGYFIR
jgi:hypothetical protein